jgi:hypothetical protein
LAFVQSHVSTEQRALAEKMTALELEGNILRALAKPASCSALFNVANLTSSTSLPFNPSVVTPTTSYNFALNEIRESGQSVVAAGAIVSPATRTLKLNAATAAQPGIQIRVTSVNPPLAMVRINFDQSGLVRQIRNPEFQIRLITTSVTGPPAGTQIDGCTTLGNFTDGT